MKDLLVVLFGPRLALEAPSALCGILTVMPDEDLSTFIELADALATDDARDAARCCAERVSWPTRLDLLSRHGSLMPRLDRAQGLRLSTL